MVKIKNIIMLLVISLFSEFALSHGGVTKKKGPFKGCHSDRAQGNFHCHSKSPYNGMSWSKVEEIVTWLETQPSLELSEGEKYDRKYFKHWIDSDKDCQDQRAEILISRSIGYIKFKESKSGRNCLVKSGLWNDFYYPEKHFLASDVDIDHIVPLKHAWESGASKWTASEREKFANDPENLVITNKSYNRKKGAQTPLTWVPLNKDYACKYLNKWFEIKKKYQLDITTAEFDQLEVLDCK